MHQICRNSNPSRFHIIEAGAENGDITIVLLGSFIASSSSFKEGLSLINACKKFMTKALVVQTVITLAWATKILTNFEMSERSERANDPSRGNDTKWIWFGFIRFKIVTSPVCNKLRAIKVCRKEEGAINSSDFHLLRGDSKGSSRARKRIWCTKS